MHWLLIGVGVGIGLFVGVLVLLFILHLLDDWLSRRPRTREWLAIQQRRESTAATPSVPRSPVGRSRTA